MASEVPEVEIVTNTESTDSTDTTKEPVSLLEKLRCPTQSDLCRKRKVQTLKPTAIKKRHQAGASNPTDPKSVTALSRVKEFPGENLVVKKDKLFCSACREELALKKSTIINHIGGVKHKKSKKALEKRQAREQDIARILSVYDEEVVPKGSASVSMDTRVNRSSTSCGRIPQEWHTYDKNRQFEISVGGRVLQTHPQLTSFGIYTSNPL